jgi:NAD+ kinase
MSANGANYQARETGVKAAGRRLAQDGRHVNVSAIFPETTMADTFKRAGIIGKYADPTVGATLKVLADYLAARQIEVMLDEATAEVWTGHGLNVANRETLGQECDLAIVVGGDGTLLNAARSLAPFDIALVGVNQGHLGFLTDVSPAEMEEKLSEILAGQYNEDERFLLHCTVLRDGEHINESVALNDVVVHKWDVARMLETETYVNGHFLNNLRSDGLIVSTPTGSTAYALSGGGPILQPCLNAIVLVPICPHTMSNRPIVVDGGNIIEIIVRGSGHSHAQVTCDGQINFGLMAGDRVRVRKAEHKVRLIHPVDHDHFHILRNKLSWG